MDDYGLFLQRVLRSVQVMHRRGYEDLWALPSVGGAGFFRLVLTAGTNLDRDYYPIVEMRALRYSSSTEYRLFDWDDVADATPAELADKLIVREPKVVCPARRPNAAYVAWYAGVLDHAGPDGLFLMYDGNRYPEPPGPFYWWPHREWHGDYELLPPLPPRQPTSR